jgi:hypothetical protein
MPGVEGTIWRFPAAAGHTTTSTLFRLTIIDGDTMRGTWERLGGNDAGQKHTSVLHRAAG